jgi:ribosomal protein S27E
MGTEVNCPNCGGTIYFPSDSVDKMIAEAMDLVEENPSYSRSRPKEEFEAGTCRDCSERFWTRFTSE